MKIKRFFSEKQYEIVIISADVINGDVAIIPYLSEQSVSFGAPIN